MVSAAFLEIQFVVFARLLVLLASPHTPVSLSLLQDRFKSSFFFIESMFYNDLRDPNAINLST